MGARTTLGRAGVLWITGLSSAGKSVVARRVMALARPAYPNTVLLDGDDVRTIFGNDVGYDVQGRLTNAFRLARLCEYLSAQGQNVICATMSLFPEVWSWNRAHLAHYFEVYLRVPLSVVERRDRRGLYARARAGLLANVVGVDLPVVEPPQSHLVIDNDEELSDVTPVAEKIMNGAPFFSDWRT